MEEADVGVLDLGILIGYFVIVTMIGFYVGRKKKENAHDYFVTKGRLPWYLIGFGSIFEYFQHCWAFIAAPVAAVFILGVLWKQANEKGAFWTLMLCLPGFVFPYARLVLEERYGIRWNAFNLAGVYFIFSTLFMIAVSVLTKPPKPEEVEGYTWSFSMTRLPVSELAGGHAWYKKLWLWSTIMVITYVIIYVKFW